MWDKSCSINDVQQQIYSYLEELQSMTSEISPDLQQRIPNELLSELARALTEGPIFEIVSSLTEVQHATEKQLFRERLQVLRGHSKDKLDFQAKYQETICDISDPGQVMKATEELELERKKMEERHDKELKDFDKQIIMKLDQQFKDQQSTLERAGIPGMHDTDDKVNIKVQMHLLKCITTLGNKYNQAGAQSDGKCYKLQPGIESLHARFSKGQPEGKGHIKYSDGFMIEANFVKGRLNGKVRLFDSAGGLQAVGLYQRGLPHGPFWLFSYKMDQFVQVHFHHGRLVPESTIVVDSEAEWAWMGTLVNNTWLENASKIDVDWVGEFNCIQVMRIPQEEENPQEEKELVRLPVKLGVDARTGKITIRPSQMLYFNRVAKTGSQSFTHLLKKQGEKLGFEVLPKIRQVEVLTDDYQGLTEEVESIMRTSRPTALVRHYSFINFHDLGYSWAPDWFNIVRDPIDKIVSWFYYWRAAWNVVSRKKAFPNEPLPDIEFLRKDFDTCVLTNDPECRFEQDSDAGLANDHRGQVMQFCGHEPVCRKFNNAEALQRAKANVERYYDVVGITEDINMTLAVLEARMPQYFLGSAKLYNTDQEVKKFRMKNPYKLPVSQQVMDIVKANFTQEIEFYQFCKQRLTEQFKELKNIE